MNKNHTLFQPPVLRTVLFYLGAKDTLSLMSTTMYIRLCGDDCDWVWNDAYRRFFGLPPSWVRNKMGYRRQALLFGLSILNVKDPKIKGCLSCPCGLRLRTQSDESLLCSRCFLHVAIPQSCILYSGLTCMGVRLFPCYGGKHFVFAIRYTGLVQVSAPIYLDPSEHNDLMAEPCVRVEWDKDCIICFDIDDKQISRAVKPVQGFVLLVTVHMNRFCRMSTINTHKNNVPQKLAIYFSTAGEPYEELKRRNDPCDLLSGKEMVGDTVTTRRTFLLTKSEE